MICDKHKIEHGQDGICERCWWEHQNKNKKKEGKKMNTNLNIKQIKIVRHNHKTGQYQCLNCFGFETYISGKKIEKDYLLDIEKSDYEGGCYHCEEMEKSV